VGGLDVARLDAFKVADRVDEGGDAGRIGHWYRFRYGWYFNTHAIIVATMTSR
jgi:hypothetical protein